MAGRPRPAGQTRGSGHGAGNAAAAGTGGATRGFWYVLIMISYEMDIHIPQRARSFVRSLVRAQGGRGGRGVAAAGCPLVVWPLSFLDPLARPLADPLTIAC